MLLALFEIPKDAQADTPSSDEPPTFVVVGEHDGIVSPAAMKRRVNALRAHGTIVELHEFPDLAHGFGTGSATSADGWIAEAVRFWRVT